MTRAPASAVSKDVILPPTATLDAGAGGLLKLNVNAPHGSGEVFLHGGHLASWTPVGHRPVLWMSGTSRFNSSAPIRGGVPVCFPWFGHHSEDPEAAQHGFARVSPWQLIDVCDVGSAVSATLRLTNSDVIRSLPWTHRFEARYTVTIGAELQLALEVVNRDQTAFTFEEALHTYFAVADVRASRITGLEGLPYYEVGAPSARKQKTPVRIETGISQRYSAGAAATIEDCGNQRLIRVNPQGQHGAIVWNPGPKTARDMEDFDDDGWADMLCLETCNIKPGAIRLEPGQRSVLGTRISVEHRR